MQVAAAKPVERTEQRTRSKLSEKRQTLPDKRDPLKLTAYSTVLLTLGFSAWLNGEANAYYAGEDHIAQAWIMGLSVPALVFLMGRIAQHDLAGFQALRINGVLHLHVRCLKYLVQIVDGNSTG